MNWPFAIPQFHENPSVIAWWERHLGLVLNWMTPSRRRIILAISAVAVGFSKPIKEVTKFDHLPVPQDHLGMVLVCLTIFTISWLLYRISSNFNQLPSPVRRHPQLTLHLIYWGTLALVWSALPPAGLWLQVLTGVAMIFPLVIWRFGYMLLAGQHGKMAGTRFSDHFLTIWPAYGGTNTPYGKGLGYLSRCEARDTRELAVSQLAGIRLLLISGVLYILFKLFKGLVYGEGNAVTDRVGFTIGVTELGILLKQGGSAPLAESWVSIYCELIYQVLDLSIRGHQIVAWLRLFGFNVFRNTYKPLLSESIVEFWNRYYYYFKELMVHFFFMPTFARCGRSLASWPRLRLFLAVFAAAFIGNSYYHLIQNEEAMVLGNLGDGIYSLRSRMFYCFLLAGGIFLSMLREQSRAGATPSQAAGNRLLRIAGVWTFFSMIYIWNAEGSADFLMRADFFLGLFGIR